MNGKHNARTTLNKQQKTQSKTKHISPFLVTWKKGVLEKKRAEWALDSM
jgi:hypothetical protein